MADDQVRANLKGMDDLDFIGWNNADWHGVFAHHHTDAVVVDMKGMDRTHGLDAHIDAMKGYVEAVGGTPPHIKSHPIAFGSGNWTCVIGEFDDGSRMVTVALPRVSQTVMCWSACNPPPTALKFCAASLDWYMFSPAT